MIFVLASAIVLLVIIGLSIGANARLRQYDRLPMQWSLTGKVNWTAPRVLALSFYPVLGAFLVGAVLTLQRIATPRTGQVEDAVHSPLIVAAVVLVIQCGHLWMIKRMVSSTRNR